VIFEEGDQMDPHKVRLDPPVRKPMRSGDGRAQPGDVLGIENDGETTELGDTQEDEDERREGLEEDIRDEGKR
jgi:hypothetical protein